MIYLEEEEQEEQDESEENIERINDPYTQKLIREAQLKGNDFKLDNEEVYAIIQNCCNGTDAYPWIRQYENKRNGRAAALALLMRYDGTAARNY